MTTQKTLNLFYRGLCWLLLFAPLHLTAQDAISITFDPLPDLCIDDTVNCTGTVSYDFQVGVDCPFGQLQVDAFLNIFNDGSLIPIANALSGSYPAYSLSGSYPLGQHSFEVVVDDGCGNIQTAVLPFEVTDCAVSMPVCSIGILVELTLDYETGLETGPQAYLSYQDVLAQPVFDCTPPVTYSINFEGEAVDPAQDSVLLDCDREGTQVLELHAQDALGNSNSCVAFVWVQNNSGYQCEGDFFGINGQVMTEDGEPVAGVPVALSGQASEVHPTNENGAFVLSNAIAGLDYTVTPQYDEAHLNGVSTLDMILISQHILGLQPLDSPYKRIAADTNGSGHISTLDLIQLRRMILGIESTFDNVSSWRFVDAAYVFPNPANPWEAPFPEVININNLGTAVSIGNDFIAIKIGDVNGDAETEL
ncbi:MAG: dockerin type I domain-containing protein [bacterium]|nr:dockerin type I domain-containing protein [bacterium]